MERTPWLGCHVNPVHHGWYEVFGYFAEVPGKRKGIAWRFWDGKNWLWWRPSIGAMHLAAVSRDDKWRGLTSPVIE